MVGLAKGGEPAQSCGQNKHLLVASLEKAKTTKAAQMSKRWGWREARVPLNTVIADFFCLGFYLGSVLGAAGRHYGDLVHITSPSYKVLLKLFLFVMAVH